jgi:hypothetical protein
MITMPLANAGTALMWGAAIHLLIGNLLIGLLEGFGLWLIFRVKFLKAVFVMIAANYVSAWAAYAILHALPAHLSDAVTLYTIQRVLWIGFGLAFLFTIFAELLFVGILLCKRKRWVLLSMAACLVINIVSYIPLAFWYHGVSVQSLFKNAVIVSKADYSIRHPKAVLYFVGEGQDIYRMRLDGSNPEKFYEPEKHSGKVILFLRQTPSRQETDLYMARSEGFYVPEESHSICLQEGVLRSSDLTFPDERGMQAFEATDFRTAEQRRWNVNAKFWAMEGLELRDSDSQEWFNIALETPFVQWYVRNATVLPDDEIIFQFGEQICIFDRESRKLALLAQGSSPVVILENK